MTRKFEEARKLYQTANADQKYVLESLFPELKESEDERIRKALIDFFSEPGRKEYILNGFTVDDILAWLEKQGEQPKKVSVWKHWKDGIAGGAEGEQIFLIKIGRVYSISSCLGCECDYIELSELDKLLSENQGEQKFADGTFVNVDDVREDFVQEVYRVLDADSTNDRANQIIDAFDNLPTVAIEKQGKQKETLCDKCRKEQPSHSCQDITALGRCALEKQGEQKPVNIVTILNDYFANTPKEQQDKDWEELKHLNNFGEFVVQKPAWSEEDERMLNHIIGYLHSGDDFQTGIDWLKSLRPQNTWKPSDEQIKALKEACNEHWEPDGLDPLYTLYQNLKKLREE